MITVAPASLHLATLQSSPSMSQVSGHGMGKSYSCDGKFSEIIGKEAGQRLVSFLRRRHPAKTAECVSAETGIPAANVSKWLTGSSLPSFTALIALGIAYDVDFWAAILPNCPDWLNKAKRDSRTAQLDREIAERMREREALSR